MPRGLAAPKEAAAALWGCFKHHNAAVRLRQEIHLLGLAGLRQQAGGLQPCAHGGCRLGGGRRHRRCSWRGRQLRCRQLGGTGCSQCGLRLGCCCRHRRRGCCRQGWLRRQRHRPRSCRPRREHPRCNRQCRRRWKARSHRHCHCSGWCKPGSWDSCSSWLRRRSWQQRRRHRRRRCRRRRQGRGGWQQGQTPRGRRCRHSRRCWKRRGSWQGCCCWEPSCRRKRCRRCRQRRHTRRRCWQECRGRRQRHGRRQGRGRW